jgi:hypothetical protein
VRAAVLAVLSDGESHSKYELMSAAGPRIDSNVAVRYVVRRAARGARGEREGWSRTSAHYTESQAAWLDGRDPLRTITQGRWEYIRRVLYRLGCTSEQRVVRGARVSYWCLPSAGERTRSPGRPRA